MVATIKNADDTPGPGHVPTLLGSEILTPPGEFVANVKVCSSTPPEPIVKACKISCRVSERICKVLK